MDNFALADQLTLLSKLMEIHGENSFKAKAYASAAFALEKFPDPVANLPAEKISAIRGIGDNAAKKVIELLQTGHLSVLEDLLAQTPEGVLDMMNIKGLGPKKINILWKELHLEDIDALREACATNRIAQTKGFGEKTQQNILEAIQYQQENSGRYLYAQVEAFTEALQAKLKAAFPNERFEITGAFRRQCEIIDEIEFVTTTSYGVLKKFFTAPEYTLVSDGTDLVEFMANSMIRLLFHLTNNSNFEQQLFITTGSSSFVNTLQLQPAWRKLKGDETEHELLKKLNLPFIPPALREMELWDTLNKGKVPDVVQLSDIRGLVHSHSNWSDGGYAIKVMAEELVRRGFEYLVLSDHSKAAFYANGLNEERIRAQHQEIDTLNQQLAPFKIFKSIECDILNDGQMDFDTSILSSFDVVIASVHSNLRMTEEKAMSRLMGAITNPCVSILGHMTGRLLLKRAGFPVDHKTVIDACAEHNVVIEINASPQRLDMDWRWIDYALQRGVLLSINPDAHTIDDFGWLKYGVLVAQKGGLTKEKNLSSFTLARFENFVAQQKAKRRIIQ